MKNKKNQTANKANGASNCKNRGGQNEQDCK